MEIEISVGEQGTSAMDIVFDSRDHLDGSVPPDDAKDEIAHAFASLDAESGRCPVFLLLAGLKNLAITDMYLQIWKVGLEKGFKKARVVVASEQVRAHLMDKIPAADPLTRTFTFGDKTLVLTTGDITERNTEAIVNASNTRLVLGAGVSGAIREKAGPELQHEMSLIAKGRSLAPGDVALTGAYRMQNCRAIIHAATANGTARCVSAAIKNALEICRKNSISSVCFPALGTGTGGLDIAECADITIQAILDFWAQPESPSNPKLIEIVLWTASTYRIFESAVEGSSLGSKKKRSHGF